MPEFAKVGVVGVGAMGGGIVQMAAQAGAEVVLFDARPGGAKAAVEKLGATWDGLAAKGRMTAEAVAAAKARLTPAASIADLARCDLVIEAIVEDLEVKRKTFVELETVVRHDCVLATNTSSLSVTAIAAACARPERVAGYHFFNPVPLMKVVEVIDGARTAAGISGRLAAFAREYGHRPIACIDSPGFVVNHAGRGFGTEALQIVVGEGAAAYADVDRALRDQVGFRLGPFELLDLTGLDVSQPVGESMFRQFYGEARFRPSWLLKQRLDAGLLGRKAGHGFYAHGPEGQEKPPEQAIPRADPRPVWVVAVESAWRDEIVAIVQAAGWPVASGPQPPDDALIVVAPLGHDATAAAEGLQVPATRLVAIDALFGLAKRRVIMAAPGADTGFVEAAHALFAADGTPVTRIRDSAGFIAQRVVATIVNIASDMAQQRIASPADIDDAVRLGLGYPQGPLALGDAVGPERIAAILAALNGLSGDLRYRASPWLRRRAGLGLSLATPEP
ncbi:3-hydroxyacyl-CoA dehydrogenase [Phreatobacter stygius]|uniref:3-hydroxyacyl-CoA dehydrogenase n=1 Tax=Phreatobacter stygius TaxID=1940610 RepID=A0A4D7BBT5_9HYPH|nr:3-hydroxyacyl-CoA dehydrogenase [Phreatobacter stygius]QCI65487.1 3-hydroxyacyl-CoA dehydrogenase [Phreatobacter stygius]